MSYAQELARQLAAVGIRGGRQERIVIEVEDHLECDPGADLGEPAALARQFADELGTSLSRRAALWSFGALALTGIVFAAVFLSQAGGSTLARAVGDAPSPLAPLGAVMSAIGCQVAFVAGLLAAARGFRDRSQSAVSRAQATIVVRRAATGLAGGLLATAGLAMTAVSVHTPLATWWPTLAGSGAAVGAAALLLAAPRVVAAARLRPIRDGAPGDIFDDLGPLVPPGFRGRPWRLALAVAGALALIITLAGIVQADPYDGALRGLADGTACLAGFAVLGRFLGLRG